MLFGRLAVYRRGERVQLRGRIVTLREGADCSGGRDMLAFASAIAPPVAANRKGQTMRITHSTLTKLAKIKCSCLIDVGS